VQRFKAHGGNILEWLQSGATLKQILLFGALICKKHKNKITAAGAFPKGKIWGMVRTCVGGRQCSGSLLLPIGGSGWQNLRRNCHM
jgi:hypothetical protein